jgi:hypothetical protein
VLEEAEKQKAKKAAAIKKALDDAKGKEPRTALRFWMLLFSCRIWNSVHVCWMARVSIWACFSNSFMKSLKEQSLRMNVTAQIREIN